jgi:hypothetical protein
MSSLRRVSIPRCFSRPEAGQARRGRHRKYGERLSKEAIEALPAIELTMRLYGKGQRVRLRSTTALARFLKGLPVHGRVVPVL